MAHTTVYFPKSKYPTNEAAKQRWGEIAEKCAELGYLDTYGRKGSALALLEGIMEGEAVVLNREGYAFEIFINALETELQDRKDAGMSKASQEELKKILKALERKDK